MSSRAARITRNKPTRTPEFPGQFDEWELEPADRQSILQFMAVDADEDRECTCEECEANVPAQQRKKAREAERRKARR